MHETSCMLTIQGSVFVQYEAVLITLAKGYSDVTD